MTKYKIFGLGDNKILVVVLSLELTQQYWDSLQLDLKNKAYPSSTVYMDFLYRNGKTRRFLKTSYDGNHLSINGVLMSEIPTSCKRIADVFFYKNYSLYRGSVLSESKLMQYLKQIKNRYNLL